MPDELKKFQKYLDDNKIEYTLPHSIYHKIKDACLNIYRIHFVHNNKVISVISGKLSYGGENGLLEMCIGASEPIGFLTC